MLESGNSHTQSMIYTSSHIARSNKSANAVCEIDCVIDCVPSGAMYF